VVFFPCLVLRLHRGRGVLREHLLDGRILFQRAAPPAFQAPAVFNFDLSAEFL
jgi:hypothetical protein